MPARETKRRSSKRKSTKRVTVDNYHDDPLYPRIVRAVEALLARGKVVAPVDVRWGKGPKHRLRFTKTGDRRLEEAYSRPFISPRAAP